MLMYFEPTDDRRLKTTWQWQLYCTQPPTPPLWSGSVPKAGQSPTNSVGQVSIPADWMVYPTTRRIGISALQTLQAWLA